MGLKISEEVESLIESEIAEIYRLGGGANCPGGPQDVILKALRRLKEHAIQRRGDSKGTAYYRVLSALFGADYNRTTDVANKAEISMPRASELLRQMSVNGLTKKSEQGLWKLTEKGQIEAFRALENAAKADS